MRPEMRDQFIANANAAARSMGAESFQDGIDLVRRNLAFLAELFDRIQTPELLVKSLDEFEVIPELEVLLVQFVGAGPLVLRWLAKKFNESAQESLPALPNRRPPIEAKAQVEMLRFVNDLHFEHDVPLEDAMKQAALKYGCGVRTIERYWQDRKNILANGPKYGFDELIKAVVATVSAEMAEGAQAKASVPFREDTKASSERIL
jgi:hypothetical protein